MNWNWLTIVAVAGLILCGAGGAGCSEPRPPLRVTSDDVRIKVLAIQRAVEAGDRSVIPQLVKDLDNDDPAVRFYASEGLERLTGETFGYRYYDERLERQPAVKRWQAWLATQSPESTKTTTQPSP